MTTLPTPPIISPQTKKGTPMPETVDDYKTYLQTLSYDDLTAIYQSLNRAKYPDRFEAVCQRLDLLESSIYEPPRHPEDKTNMVTILTPITDIPTAEQALINTFKNFLMVTGIEAITYIPIFHMQHWELFTFLSGTTISILLIATGVRVFKSRFLSVFLFLKILAVLIMSIAGAYMESKFIFPILTVFSLYLSFRFIKATRILFRGPSLNIKQTAIASLAFATLIIISGFISYHLAFPLNMTFFLSIEALLFIIFDLALSLSAFLMAAIIFPLITRHKQSITPQLSRNP